MKLDILNNNAKTTIIYIHGYASNGASVNGIKSESKNFNLISFDYPKDKIYNVQEMAEKVNKLVSRVKGPVVLMGHSLGGAIMSETKDRFKIKKFIYISALTPIVINQKSVQFLAKDSRGHDKFKKLLGKSLKGLGYENIAQFLDPPKDMLRFAKENILNFKYLDNDLRSNYASKANKSIALIGSRDTAFKYDEYEHFMHDNNIKCYTINGAKHNPMEDAGIEVAIILNNEIKFKKRWRRKIIKDA